jgi:hypothetical protein
MWGSTLNLAVLCLLSLLLWIFATPQLAAAYTYSLVCMLCMAFSTSIAWYRRPMAFSLPDIGHDILPEMLTMLGVDSHVVCDQLLFGTALATLALVWQHPRRICILKRFLVVYGSLMFLRAGTLLMTSLPDPYSLCATIESTRMLNVNTSHLDAAKLTESYQRTWSNMPWLLVFENMMGLFGNNKHNAMTCGDLIFSGHTVVFVLCALVWHNYYRNSSTSFNPVKLIVWVCSIMGTVLLLVTRMHWTIDIALAYYITTSLWNFYHGVCNALALEHYIKPVLWIDGILIYPFIAWIETGISFHQFHNKNMENKIRLKLL